MSEGIPEPTEEQIRAFEEQLSRLRVEDVIVQTLVTLVNLGARKLGLTGEPGSRDLEQAQLAIEGARALMPLVPGDELGPIREALSQLQVAFAREAQGLGTQPPGEPPAPEGDQRAGEQPSQEGMSDAEREQARSKIWTPPGA
jgi:hypothetical protein